MSGHLTDCTTLLEGEAQTEYHAVMGEHCPACEREFAEINEGERYAEFGMGFVTSGGDPGDVSAAWAMDKALIAERDEEERNRRIEDEAADEAYRRAVTRPKDRPVKGWRDQHFGWTGEPFKGKWEYEPGCGCAKCFNHDLFIQDCLGEWEFVT